MTETANTLLAPRFLFRLAVPLARCDIAWQQGGVPLPETDRLLDLAALDSSTQHEERVFADVRMAWSETGLWRRVVQLADSNSHVDVDAIEAKRFGVTTSGHCLLFDRSGRRLFSGGVTISRGHEGQSIARLNLDRLLRGERFECQEYPVFGCPLFENSIPNAAQRPQPKSRAVASAVRVLWRW